MEDDQYNAYDICPYYVLSADSVSDINRIGAILAGKTRKPR